MLIDCVQFSLQENFGRKIVHFYLFLSQRLNYCKFIFSFSCECKFFEVQIKNAKFFPHKIENAFFVHGGEKDTPLNLHSNYKLKLI